MTAGGATARLVLRLILLLALVGVLTLNWPGHLSVDSVLALHEGRFQVRETWNPAIFGWLLGVLDRLHPGGALATVLSGVLLFGAWMVMPSLRPRTTWLAPILALGLVALPQVLIYPGIVWKDVWFAVATLAGFVVLAIGVRDPQKRAPWTSLMIAALLFAVAGLLRQNGLIFAIPAALALAWARSRFGWGPGVRLALGWLVAVFVLALLLSATARPQGVGAPDDSGGKGVRLLQSYDLAAAAALRPDRPTPHIDAIAPDVGAYIRTHADRLYSPHRVDVLTADAWLGQNLPRVPPAAIQADWLDLITRDPGLYLQGRALAFQQVVASPDVRLCLPVHVGITGPAGALGDLGIARRADAHDGRIYNYATWFFDTPAMSHLVFGAIAFVVFAWLMIRRDPADLVIAGLMAGALGFAASFFAISIACDYRYLYVLDLAAITGALYLAIDPTLRRQRP
jgi:hypothetical protein